MSQIILSPSNALPVPQPKEKLTIRPGNAGDFGFIDELQKQYSKQLGFMPTMWLEGKVKADHILIASIGSERVGYIIAQDNYLKREELGIVYQLCVVPGRQRGFIGAALLKAQFDRSAPGCRLYCCWCAQDIEANKFWESMGYVPLAYRNGAEKKGKDGKHRVQIFWQKRIRGNEDTYPWWYPCKTDQGAMRADRIALPILPGVNWRDLEPIEIPTIGGDRMIEDQSKKPREKKVKLPAMKPTTRFVPPGMELPEVKVVEQAPIEKPKRERKPKAKIDPKFIAMSRAVRDKYLEEVNENGYRLQSVGKYELTRDQTPHPAPESRRLLPQGERGKYKLLEAA